MRHTILAALVVALAASTAAADEIQLTNGHKIVGIVTKKDADKVTVEVGAGTITLAAKDVSSISLGKTALNEYDERWAAVKDSKNAAQLWELAGWAKSKGLTRYPVPLSTQIIAIDPDHAGARAELRHEKVGGKWLTFDQAQEARGLVQMDDHWVTRAEIQMMEQRRLEARARSAAAEEVRKQHKDEERAARQAAMEAYNQQYNSAMAGLDGYFYTPSFCFSPYYRPYPWAAYQRSRNYYQHGWMYNGYGGYGSGYVGLNWGGLIVR
jgi:hypothetical protein